MKALVIGATGFIGLHVVDALLERGVEVSATRRKRSFTLLLRKRAVTLVEASLDDRASLERAMAGHEVVVFTAGHYPRYSLDEDATLKSGLEGLRAVLEAARAAGVGRVVYTSSTATLDLDAVRGYADERDRAKTEPVESLYRKLKWRMERMCDDANTQGLDVVTVLPGGCIGPWDMRLGTTGLLAGVMAEALPWMVDGIVNVVHVRDVGAVHAEAALRGAPGQRYCVAGHALQLSSLMRQVETRYGGKVPPLVLDLERARERADAEELRAAPKRERVPFPRELVDVVASGVPVSSARAEAELGLRTTPLIETLDESVEWLRRHRFVPEMKAS